MLNGQRHAVLGISVRSLVKQDGISIEGAEVYILDPNASAVTGWYSVMRIRLLTSVGALSALQYPLGEYRPAEFTEVPASD